MSAQVPDEVTGIVEPEQEVAVSTDEAVPVTEQATEQANQDRPAEDLVAEIEFTAPKTGDDDIDDALVALADSAATTPEEQLPVIEAVHRTLQDRLADVEG